ncbi:MAG: glycosyltransferase, partial [Candidatus Thorarchaeota archaeon]
MAYLLTLLLFTIRSIYEVIKFGADIVVSAHASPIVGVVAFSTAKLTRRPILMGCPDWMSAYAAGLMSTGLNTIGPIFLQLIEFRLYRWSNGIVAATEFLANLISKMGISREKITVISNGVDINLFNPKVEVAEIKAKYRLQDRCV